MAIFKNRPLCFFCFLFLLTSAVIGYSDLLKNFTVLWIVGGLTVISVILCIILKSKRTRILYAVFSLVAVLGALLNYGFRVDLKQYCADEYIGKRTVAADVLECNYVSEYSASYTVKLDTVSDNDTSIKAVLVSAFPLELSVGDTLYAEVELMDMDTEALGMSGSQRSNDSSVVLMAVLYTPDGAEVHRFDREEPIYKRIFEKNGLNALISDSKEIIGERINTLFDKETAAMTKGILLGDKSDISTSLIRDYRRTGLLHLFAVSGMHITIFLGALDKLLQSFNVKRNSRWLVIALMSVPMLALTGFAMSAIRAVIMLWISYAVRLLREDSDHTTSLMFTVVIIILIYPYSVFDLGMWLSFFAMLGITVLYDYVNEEVPKVKRKQRFRKLFRTLRNIFMTVVMTVSCGIFVLPLQWYIFGEASLMSIPANLIVASLATVFMILSVIATFFGGIPLLGDALTASSEVICRLMSFFVRKLSALDFATVSLRYHFADIIIIVFICVFVVFLLVELKRKWLTFVPIAVFALVFASSVAIFNYINPQKLTYYGNGNMELMAVTSSSDLTIVDMSGGALKGFSTLLEDAGEYGTTEVEKIIFTRINKTHISNMDYFLRNNIVRSIYIPTPESQEELDNAKSMAEIAEDCNTNVYLYSPTEPIEHGGIILRVGNIHTNDDKKSTVVFVNTSDRAVGYVDAFASETSVHKAVDSEISKCDTVIIGNNGVSKFAFTYDVKPEAMLIYASEDIRKMSRISNRVGDTYCNTKEEFKITLNLKD